MKTYVILVIFRKCSANCLEFLIQLDLFPTRARAFQSLPMGRRRPFGHLRSSGTSLFLHGPLERTGCHSKGAALWTNRSWRQSRRRRQRMLLPSRQHSYSLVHESFVQISSYSFPLSSTGWSERRKKCPGSGIWVVGHEQLQRRLLGRVYRVRKGFRQFDGCQNDHL